MTTTTCTNTSTFIYEDTAVWLSIENKTCIVTVLRQGRIVCLCPHGDENVLCMHKHRVKKNLDLPPSHVSVKITAVNTKIICRWIIVTLLL